MSHYYRSTFPTIWERMDELVKSGQLLSVKEALQEIDANFPSNHVEEWLQVNRHIFHPPTEDELKIVAEIFKLPQFHGLVKKENLLKGRPVADPFIVAAGKVQNRTVVTSESFKQGGARIPTVCRHFSVKCVGVEDFLELEKLKY